MSDRDEFRLDRVASMQAVSAALQDPIAEVLTSGLEGEQFANAVREVVVAEFVTRYSGAEFAAFPSPRAAAVWMWIKVRPGLDAAKATANPKRIADWLGTAIVNAADVARVQDQTGKEWLSRRDDRVRPAHVDADGQVVPWDGKFTVCGGVEVDFPGQPVGDPSCWLNCRCALRPAPLRQDGPMSEPFGGHDLIWYEGRRTPEVVSKGAKGKKGGAGTKAGKVVKRRAATADEERRMRGGKWLRVNRDGKKPGQPGYMGRKSKVRPQNNAVDGVELAEEPIDLEAFMEWLENDYTGAEFAPDPVTTDEEDPMVDSDETPVDDEFAAARPVPWYSVFAPEGVWSGDKRRFAAGALSWRDLPLPLMRQERNAPGHDGSVQVGSASHMWRDEASGTIRAVGTFATNDAADEAIGLIADGHLRGVSVDVDSAEMALEADEESVTFSRGRVSAATIVPIPAFQEAFIALGEPPEDWGVAHNLVSAAEFRDYTAEERDRMAEDGRALPDGSFPIADVDDLRNAIQAIGRAKDQKSARAHIAKRARALGEGDLIPEGWSVEDAVAASAAVEAFKRGPGWVTDPVATKRIHDYWTKPGEEGYAKIGWGTPGDFRRLRAALAEYVSPQYLNRTAAQWHHDALGYWPGEKGKPGNPMAGELAPAMHLAASGTLPVPPAEWFTDPSLNGPTPLTITDDGRVFGHLAAWGTCHIGMSNTCVTPPPSPSSYAYYRTGRVRTTGDDVAVGHITLGTGHASTSPTVTASQAAAHYDNTGSVVADVAAGEDQFGIWVAGAMRASASDQQIADLRAASLSGDWRRINGHLELVAALAVNVPGFPIPQTGLAASGVEQVALVAAGVVSPTAVDVQGAVSELATLVADELAARAERRRRAAGLMGELRSVRAAVVTAGMEF